MDAIEKQRLTVACRLLGKSLVDELRLIESVRCMEWTRVRDAYQSLRDEAIREATAKIDAMLVAEKAEVSVLRRAYDEAEQDVKEARIAEFEKKGWCYGDKVWPIGSKVKRLVKRNYRTETEYGVIEIFTLHTLFPANIRYSIPMEGSPFVRILKKDGTPGLRFDNSLYGWELAEEGAGQ